MYCMQPGVTTVTEVPCDQPGALVVLTRLELQQLSPFYLDIESAMAIGGAILLVMAVAFCFRVASKALATSEPKEET